MEKTDGERCVRTQRPTAAQSALRSYLLHAHAASLGGVPDKRRLLGEGGAVAVTAVYLQSVKSQPALIILANLRGQTFVLCMLCCWDQLQRVPLTLQMYWL